MQGTGLGDSRGYSGPGPARIILFRAQPLMGFDRLWMVSVENKNVSWRRPSDSGPIGIFHHRSGEDW